MEPSARPLWRLFQWPSRGLLLHLVDVEFVPNQLKVPTEFRTLARLKGSRPVQPKTRIGNAVHRLDAARSSAHDDDSVGHADRLTYVMRHEHDRLPLACENRRHLVRERETGLVVQ